METTTEQPRAVLTDDELDAHYSNPKYINVGTIGGDNGDSYLYGKTPDAQYERLGLFSTTESRKISKLKQTLQVLEEDKDREDNKEVRLKAIEALLVLIN